MLQMGRWLKRTVTLGCMLHEQLGAHCIIKRPDVFYHELVQRPLTWCSTSPVMKS